MKYKEIFFDLDGTITEPALGITNGIIYALDKYNIKVSDRRELYKFIGPPLRDSFSMYYGFDKDEVEKVVAYYREYYSDMGIIENEPMPGIEKALSRLKSAGLKLYVATSKPEKFAIQILEHLNLLSYFDIVAGSSMDGSRDSKESVIKYLIEQIHKDGNDDISPIMVGDRMYDVEGASKCGIDCIGVTFGYGDRQELEEAGANIIVDTAEEIADYILAH
ncbi:MAG: HAD hydrolase-like protein [Lachnospiraceae bacterium]|nr:HAD hydrolase-like protein [Lachnospiraceae bacterium]